MSFCKECGAETPEDVLKSYSGYCLSCHLSLSENNSEDSPYPQFYPNELKHLNKEESIPASFEATPVPSIEEIKRLSKYKIKINLGVKNLRKIFIVIGVSLPFLFSFYFINAIAYRLSIDYSYAFINTYALVAFISNLIYYGIIGLCFLIGGIVGLVEEDSGVILPVGICFSVLFIIMFAIFGFILWGNFAPMLSVFFP